MFVLLQLYPWDTQDPSDEDDPGLDIIAVHENEDVLEREAAAYRVRFLAACAEYNKWLDDNGGEHAFADESREMDMHDAIADKYRVCGALIDRVRFKIMETNFTVSDCGSHPKAPPGERVAQL